MSLTSPKALKSEDFSAMTAPVVNPRQKFLDRKTVDLSKSQTDLPNVSFNPTTQNLTKKPNPINKLTVEEEILHLTNEETTGLLECFTEIFQSKYAKDSTFITGKDIVNLIAEKGYSSQKEAPQMAHNFLERNWMRSVTGNHNLKSNSAVFKIVC